MRTTWRWVRIPIYLLLALHAFWAVCLVSLRFIDPITTGVQVQRRVESWFGKGSYTKRSTWVDLDKISIHLQHAVISAEDGNFYKHNGVDWEQVEIVMDEALEEGEIPRGASTITQQLMKNLFFTTHRNPLRKVFEYTLAPMATLYLGKRRILELYLNVVEWGPGVWGAEAAAAYHFKGHASNLTRDQAARLAACLPAPRRRKAGAMNRYSAIITNRMDQHGW